MTKSKKPAAKRPGKGIRARNEAKLIAAGEIVFSESGYRGARIQEIAKIAKIPKANLHYYFPTKMDLYKRVITEACVPWLSAIDIDEELEPDRAIEGYIRKKLELSREKPLSSRLWAIEIIRGAPLLKEFLENDLKEWFEKVKTKINHWAEEGKMDPVDPAHFLYMIWASTQHYADFAFQIQVLNDDKPLSDAQYEKAADQLCDIILKGVGLKSSSDKGA